jgi:putative transposase
MRKQCQLLGLSRSTIDYEPVPESEENWRIKRLLDEIYLNDPCLGTRRLITVLERDYSLSINRKRLQRLRHEMGMEAIYCKPRTSLRNEEDHIWPYLLRDMQIEQPNHVWCTDITYIPMPRGHAFLCAIMDWYSRRVLGWSLSNTMDTGLCLRALEQAKKVAGQWPEIINTDQGSQFTSREWTGKLTEHGVKISMDGRGRYMDNIFIERLWRSLKYEDIYLHEYANLTDLSEGLARWFGHYNAWRPHAALGNKTPQEVYEDKGITYYKPKAKPFEQAA